MSSLATSFQKENDDEVIPEQEHAGSLGTIRSLNVGLEPLWQETSLCISKMENRSSSLSLVPSASGNNAILPPLLPGTQRVLPYIEAVDPDYYKNLKRMFENDIRDMPDLTFSVDASREMEESSCSIWHLA